MKVRRVTLEVEVPWEFSAAEVLRCVRYGVDEATCEWMGHADVPHQEQVVGDVESPSTQVDGVAQWPLPLS